ncbi:MAG: L-lactate dehydrogenase [Candidatus Woesearchaeota archaeon]
MDDDKTKIAIIGAGFVGSTAAYALFIEGIASEISIIDVKKEKAQGEALDLVHGMLFSKYTKVTYGSDYKLCEDADIIVITAGANQKPGETRLDLTKKNAAIMKEIVPEIVKHNKTAILLMVTNPLDVMTYLALKLSRFTPNKVFGTGTILDTARFRHNLSEYYGVNPQSIHAYILGEHGDSEFPVWSSANIAGMPLKNFEKYDLKKLDEIFHKTKNAAYEIISRKGATYYAIGLAISKVVKTILLDQHEVLPLSTLLKDYYGITDVCLSIPVVLSRNGIRKKLKIPLDKTEIKALRKSAGIIRKNIESVL